MKYLHTMIRVDDPDATIRFDELDAGARHLLPQQRTLDGARILLDLKGKWRKGEFPNAKFLNYCNIGG